MFFYYLRMAWKNIAKSPLVSVIIITAIAIGITVATSILSIRHVMGANPIPHKSDQLFNVRLESWETNSEFFGPAGEPPKHITYRDMRGLLQGNLPTYQTGVGKAYNYVFPENANIRPYGADIRLCHPDFFPMFEVPIQYGTYFTEEANQRRERVTLLSHETNEKLFKGADSVGQSVKIGPERYTIIGVLAPYRPTPQFYDVLNNTFGTVCDFFVPFDLILEDPLELVASTQSDSFGNNRGFDTNEAYYMNAERHWIQYWVQLDQQEDVLAYKNFVDDYAREQKKLGRFPRPLNNRVTPLMEWLAFRKVAPAALKGMVVIALLFLVVCSLNLLGLLLGKFLAGANFVGIRRALGASKRHIFFQHLSECLLVGLVGGLIGIAGSYGALDMIWRLAPPGNFHEGFKHLDTTMLLVALGLSLSASLIAGLYPAWRACNIVPAVQIKLQ